MGITNSFKKQMGRSVVVSPESSVRMSESASVSVSDRFYILFGKYVYRDTVYI